MSTPSRIELVRFLALNGLTLGLQDEISQLLTQKGVDINKQMELWKEAEEYLAKKPISIPNMQDVDLTSPSMKDLGDLISNANVYEPSLS